MAVENLVSSLQVVRPFGGNPVLIPPPWSLLLVFQLFRTSSPPLPPLSVPLLTRQTSKITSTSGEFKRGPALSSGRSRHRAQSQGHPGPRWRWWIRARRTLFVARMVQDHFMETAGDDAAGTILYRESQYGTVPTAAQRDAGPNDDTTNEDACWGLRLRPMLLTRAIPTTWPRCQPSSHG